MPSAELFYRLRLVLALLASVTALPAEPAMQTDVRQDRALFPIQADGANARVSQRWTLRRRDKSGLGLILGMARCGDTIFLADNEYRVYSFDLRRPGPVRELVSDPASLGLPRGLAADCDRHKLYVVTGGSRMLVTVETRSGTIEHKQPLPRDLSFPHWAHVVGPDTLYVSGVFNPTPDANPYRTRQVDNFFETLRLGIRVSPSTGAIEALFQPYEKRCIGAGECISSAVGRLPAPSAPQWVVAQAASTRFGLYSASGELKSTHSTMSPRFVRDGTELPLQTAVPVRLGWSSRNSTIRSVFGVGGLIVAVHATFEGNFDRPETVPIARPFMNIHDIDGQPLVSDIRLSNLPVGADDANLYVVGQAQDRRNPGKAEQELMQIPVKRGRQSIRNQGGLP